MFQMWWIKTSILIIGTLIISLDNYPVNAKKYARVFDVLVEETEKLFLEAFPDLNSELTREKKYPDLIPVTTIKQKLHTFSDLIPEITPEKRSEAEKSELMLFDFTKLENLMGWYELSDVVRQQGLSKAVLALQKTKMFQRAVFFTLLNPQPNGAGFASYRVDVNLDLSDYKKIQIFCRGQGENSGYKVNLRHKGQNREPFPSYEQMFQAPMGKFQIVELQLANFEPYYRGQKLNDTEPLDLKAITNFEFQVYGGVYLPIKQSGTSSLEIDWIKALP